MPSITLDNEAGQCWRNPSKRLILREIGRIDTGDGNSICCLSTPWNSYVQALHGLNGWHVEWRDTARNNLNRYRHFRASYPDGSRRKRLLRKGDTYVSCGLEKDLLVIDDVVQCFLAFRLSERKPNRFEWRQLDI